MDNRRTLSMLTQETGARRLSKVGSTIITMDDGTSSETNGMEIITDGKLQRRRSSRVRFLFIIILNYKNFLRSLILFDVCLIISLF